MKSLAVRLVLLAVFIMAGGTTAYFVWTSESHARQSVDDVRAFDQAAREAERSVLEMRAAQHAYVAAGQGTAVWITKVAESARTVSGRLEFLRAHAASPTAQSAIDNAASALQDFEQIDRRARDYVRNGQALLASDVIFADGFASTDAMAASIEDARSAETVARDAAHVFTRRAEVGAVGATTLLALVTVVMLVPVPATIRARETRKDPPLMRPVGAADRSRPVEPAAGPASAAPSHQTPAPSMDLDSVASLCSDLARVVDTRALPALLGRAAAVLDAPGIVLWIADPDGRELSPIVTYGYPQQMVLRLGTILRDAENATAAALRTSLLQTVDTDSVSNGAIAAPLVTPVGCVGIMAAEVRRHGEKDPVKLATASIIAAQLATLVGPPSTRAQARADAI